MMAQCFVFVPDGGAMLNFSAILWISAQWGRNASILRLMAGGALLGLRARWQRNA
jgi:hypothetical protein